MSRVAIDCEMVGDMYNQPMLAKVTLVDANSRVIYDEYVKPTSSVGDYRNTGFSPHQLQNGKSFNQVQSDVKRLITGKTLVGHSLDADLKALNINHSPTKDIADYYKTGYERPSLQSLAQKVLGERIQTGVYHDSQEDAAATMKIYNAKPF